MPYVIVEVSFDQALHPHGPEDAIFLGVQSSQAPAWETEGSPTPRRGRCGPKSLGACTHRRWQACRGWLGPIRASAFLREPRRAVRVTRKGREGSLCLYLRHQFTDCLSLTLSFFFALLAEGPAVSRSKDGASCAFREGKWDTNLAAQPPCTSAKRLPIQ